jgi:hypothetical protein
MNTLFVWLSATNQQYFSLIPNEDPSSANQQYFFSHNKISIGHQPAEQSVYCGRGGLVRNRWLEELLARAD